MFNLRRLSRSRASYTVTVTLSNLGDIEAEEQVHLARSRIIETDWNSEKSDSRK